MKILKALKLGFQILHCLTCSHNQDCPYSLVAHFGDCEYVITVKKKGAE